MNYTDRDRTTKAIRDGAAQFYHFTKISSNKKTGKMSVTTTEKKSCPDECPLKDDGSCYAASGFHLNMHWDAVSNGEKRAISFDDLLVQVKKIKAGELWRHNQAGDLPGENGTIDLPALAMLVAANGASQGFTYTHKKKAARSYALSALMAANAAGFTVNISCDTVEEVDEFKALGLPTVLVVAIDSKGEVTPDGEKVKICPAQLEDDTRKRRAAAAGLDLNEWAKSNPLKVTCKTCGLCAIADRPHTVGFRAHGNRKNLIQIAA